MTKPFLKDFFHNRNIPDISEQHIHFDNVAQRQADLRQAFFHIIQRAVHLFFH